MATDRFWALPQRRLDWLGTPLDEATIVAHRDLWSRQNGRWMVQVLAGMALMLALLGVSRVFPPLAAWLDHTMVLIVMGAGVLWPALMAAVDPMAMQDFYPVDAAHQAEAAWWLEHVPTAQALRAHLLAEPRALRWGELGALRQAGALLPAEAREARPFQPR